MEAAIPEVIAGATLRAVAPNYPTETREKCYQLFKKQGGKGMNEISEKTGVPRVTVQRWKKTDKWEVRLHMEEKKEKAKKHDPNTPNAELSFPEKQDKFREGMAVQALRLPEILDGMNDEEFIRNADKIKNMDAIARKALNLEEAKPTTVINVALLSRPIKPLELEAPPTIEAEVVVDLPSPCTDETLETVQSLSGQ